MRNPVFTSIETIFCWHSFSWDSHYTSLLIFRLVGNYKDLGAAKMVMAEATTLSFRTTVEETCG